MNASDLPWIPTNSSPCAPRARCSSARVRSTQCGGDPKWIDHPGTYRAGLLASKVYAVFGKKGYGNDIQDWVHAPLPPVETLVGGDMAFRQHTGGHTSAPNIADLF